MTETLQGNQDNRERIIKLESAMSNIDRNLIEIKLNIEKISKKIDDNESLNRQQFATKQDLSDIRADVKAMTDNINRVVMFIILALIGSVMAYLGLNR